MAYVLVQNGIVIQKSFRARPGFIEVDDSVVCGQIDSGGGVFVNPPPTPEEIAAAAKATKDAADAAAAKAYGKLTALKAMSPAAVQTWVAANVTNLAQAQDAIATLAIAVGILARRL